MNLQKNCAILCCRNLPKWKRRRWLLQSYLMAHAKIRLELLHSCPDTVHGITLHKTLRSTFLTTRKPSINSVEKGIQLCYSGLQIQGAANSPPTRSLYIIQHFIAICNRFYCVFLCVWWKCRGDFVKIAFSGAFLRERQPFFTCFSCALCILGERFCRKKPSRTFVGSMDTLACNVGLYSRTKS